MLRIAMVCVLLTFACNKPDDGRVATDIKAPTLRNREQILREREKIGARLLTPGESLTVRVYLYVDKQGMPRQIEVKQELPDFRLRDSAIALVERMRFNPATEKGQPKDVMLTVPVRFKRD
jgi:TonB family protein